MTPAEHAVHVKAICEHARNARSVALNAFYGDTVIPGVSPGEKTAGGGGASADAAAGSAKNQ
jgi:hypothetical protein